MKHAGYRREGIGSRFPLEPGSLLGRARQELRWPADRCVALESGRSAILWLIDALGLGPGDRALLPAYVCDSAVAPFRLRGVELDFYRVGEGLEPDGEDAAARLTPRTRLLMVIHYFGFPASAAALARLPRADNLLRLEDWVQGPLTEGALADDGFGDYRVLAWHKVLPVPDSGLLLRAASAPSPPRRPPLASPRAAYFGRRLAAKGLKAVAVKLAGGSPRPLYRGLFDAAERAAGAGTHARMSRFSRRLLLRLPLAETVRRRRENFRRLGDALSDLRGLGFLRRELPDGVCPLGLPVRVPNRDGVLARLLEARIYPPVHWPLPAEVDPAAFPAEAALAAEEMTLPVDQRYGAPEMDYIAETLREALALEGRGGVR